MKRFPFFLFWSYSKQSQVFYARFWLEVAFATFLVVWLILLTYMTSHLDLIITIVVLINFRATIKSWRDYQAQKRKEMVDHLLSLDDDLMKEIQKK